MGTVPIVIFRVLPQSRAQGLGELGPPHFPVSRSAWYNPKLYLLYNAAAGAVPVLFRPPFRNFVPTLDRCQTCRILLSASRCSCSSAHCRISVLTLMFSSCINSFAKSSRVIIIVSTPSFATTVA